ncbi:type VI secretion system Vgr family protein [Polyangium aurulentum]|uniref:type VI secretion system Vgr family protein n=1 Tax=Polyangium aurulentum TaxID=2567896 RepID=UPI00146EA850|nr:type VI secretion system tip protein TssI/VgrG [Polyangium aurulentum]UQA63167.1 type VI secretion system tip protein VgrG [Polyangium aurulentum]
MANQDPLLYFIELGGETYRLTTIRGEEAISRTYRFEIELRVDPDDPLDPDAVVGTDATLVLARETTLRRVQGVVTKIQRAATRKGNAGGGRVRLVLEPRLATTRHRVDIRIFRDKTAPQIVAEVIGAHGISVLQSLVGSYVERPYCVQMRESDLDFAARLLEDEGIFYVVDDGGRMILGDFTSAYADGPGALPFTHDHGLLGQRDAVYQIGWTGRATAGKVSLRDFNPERPRLDMDVSAKGPTAWGPEWYDYPGEYELPAQGKAKVELRAEALACQKRRLAGRSVCAELRPGIRFSLFDAPPGVDDDEYVVTRVDHAWDRTEKSFSIAFEALPGTTVYRPPVETYVPTLTNPLTGFVTGPAGADIHTDSWGRVKVHFPWDRLQPKDDTCSHWIPVLQDNTGRSSAMPRTGWEVLCHFLEGDPDRPVVLGRVFNAADPFMEELPLRKMRISLQSLTSPRSSDGASGYNMIRFDDLAGAQTIDVYAQRDQNIVVANNQDEKVDAVESRTVKGNEAVRIGADERVAVSVDNVGKVDGNQSVSIGGSRSAKVTGNHTDAVNDNHSLTIGGSHVRSAGVDDNVAIAHDLTEIIGGIVLEGTGKTNTVMAGEKSVLVAGGSIFEVAELGKNEGADKPRVESVSGIVFSQADEKHGARVKESRTTTVGGPYVVSALKEILLSGLRKLTIKAPIIGFKGPSITLKVGETVIHMKNGRIDMKTSKELSIETQQQNNLGTSTSSQN